MNKGIKYTLWMPRVHCEALLRTQKNCNDNQFPYIIQFSGSKSGRIVLSHCNPGYPATSKIPILHRLAKTHHTVMDMVNMYLLEKTCCYVYVLPSVDYWLIDKT